MAKVKSERRYIITITCDTEKEHTKMSKYIADYYKKEERGRK